MCSLTKLVGGGMTKRNKSQRAAKIPLYSAEQSYEGCSRPDDDAATSNVSLEGGEEKEKKEVVVGTREIKNTQLREVGVGSSGRSHAEAGCDAPSACHPAFVYAAEHSGFSAQPWRKDNRATLSREEMETRQRTWNALVDQYIAVNQSTLDVTESCEVERAAKIFWTGGPLYNRCGHQSCGKMERQPSTFMLCSKCRQTRFCSSACFAASYYPHHHAICGTDSAEPRLASQTV